MNKSRRKILKNSLIALAVIFLTVLLVMFYLDKMELEYEFDHEVEWTINTLMMSIRDPLWNFNEITMKETLSSYLMVESVVYLKVLDDYDHFIVDAGEYSQEKNLLKMERQIIYDEKNIGHLIFYFTRKPLEESIQEKFFRLIGLILSLFVLIVVLITITSKRYAEPLTTLAKNIRKFDIRDPESYTALWENAEVEEVQEVINSYKGMAEEITANYEELEATNETLKEMNDKLEKKSRENEKLVDKLSRIIDLSSQFEETTQMENGYFMKKLFKNAFQIIPEADYGTVYIYKDNKVNFVDSVGHDLALLQKTMIPRDIFITHSTKIGVKRNLQEFTTIDFPMRTEKEKKDLKIIEQATKDFKETLFFELFVGDEVEAGISLDIASGSELSFSQESLESMIAFRSLASAFYKIQRYSSIKDNFTKELVVSIVKLLEIHDNYTKGHSEQVANLAYSLAQEAGMCAADCKCAYWTGLVHDLGKILIPDVILNKTGRLTPEEFEIIKQHPRWGYETLKNSKQLKHIARLVRHHHERWDGTGYPDQLSGNTIPEISRIITVVDAWDAMTSKRSYRNPLDFETALNEIRENAGIQFDPHFVESFVRMIREKHVFSPVFKDEKV